MFVEYNRLINSAQFQRWGNIISGFFAAAFVRDHNGLALA